MSSVDEVDRDISALFSSGIEFSKLPNLNNENNANNKMVEVELKSSIKTTPMDNGNDKPPLKSPTTNWVKFDDDGNEVPTGSTPESTSNDPLTSHQIITETAKIPNKLSPPPPRAKKSHTRGAAVTGPAVESVPVSVQNNNVNVVTPIQSTSITASQSASSKTVVTDVTPAVLNTESVHVNLNSSTTSASQNLSLSQSNGQTSTSGSNTNAVSATKSSISIPMTSAAIMRTIELSTGRVREGFANGDVIVTLLPINTKWPWVTPAVFRPELVPEELMAQGLTLTVEEYVNAMETLVNDYRFTVYNICYKRILVCWILFAFAVLLSLLFSGLQGVALFSLGVGWLFLNAAAIFLCMWIKLRLARGLEKCLARVNKQLMRHKILLVLDDRGRISCHKVNLCFLYFDPAQCVAYLNEFIERSEQNGVSIQAGWEAKLDLDINDIVIQGSNPMRLSRKQDRALLLYLRYSSRWGNEVIRGKGDVTVLEPARHCEKYVCPCKYIEEHMACKPRGKFRMFNFLYWVLASERYE